MNLNGKKHRLVSQVFFFSFCFCRVESQARIRSVPGDRGAVLAQPAFVGLQDAAHAAAPGARHEAGGFARGRHQVGTGRRVVIACGSKREY